MKGIWEMRWNTFLMAKHHARVVEKDSHIKYEASNALGEVLPACS